MKKVNSKYDEILQQINEAKIDLALARQDEQLASSQFLDLAIKKVGIAMSKLNSLYEQAKLVATEYH